MSAKTPADVAAEVFEEVAAKAVPYGDFAVSLVKAIIQAVKGARPDLDNRPLTHVSGELDAAKLAADRLHKR